MDSHQATSCTRIGKVDKDTKIVNCKGWIGRPGFWLMG